MEKRESYNANIQHKFFSCNSVFFHILMPSIPKIRMDRSDIALFIVA